MIHREKFFIYTLLFCISLLRAFAQESDSSGIVVGQSMGDYELQNLINYPTSTTRLSSFKNKLIILDFWSTSCGACVDSWPKLLKLQQEFSDRIQIILVNTHQDERVVRAMFEKRKRLAGVDVTLPTVCGDTTLSAMFPRLGVPHVVWVDSCQTVRSITYGPSLNSKNIARMLADPSTNMIQKQIKPSEVPYTITKPMFVDGNGGDGKSILFHNVLSGYVGDLSYNQSIRGNPKTGRFAKIISKNQSRARLYALAYTFETRPDGMPYEVYPNRIIFKDDKTKEQFFGLIDDEESRKDLFCYELQTDSTSAAEVFKIMRSDLERFFHHRVQVKEKKVDVYALSIIDASKIPKQTDKQFSQGIDESQFRLNGAYTMYEVTKSLRDLYFTSPYPVIDETNYSGRLYNIDLFIDTRNPDALNKALNQYGLAFKLVKREIPMIIISDPVRTVESAN